jgi:hypothetical protein
MDTVEARVRWAAREGVVLLGILAFWLVAFVASVVLFVAHVAGLRPVTAFASTLQHSLWAVLVPLVAANASLYAFVRAGTVLIDHYRE